MDKLGKAGSLNPGKPPAGSAGDGQGAFENFLASAIATIVTIIFSWRLLLETQESGPKAIESAEAKDDKFQHNKLDKRSPKEKIGENMQVDIDQRTVSKVTSENSALTFETLKRNDTEYNQNVTGNNYKTKQTPNHVDKMSRDNQVGFVVSGSFASGTNTCVTKPDQYLPASGAAAAKDNSQTQNANSEEQTNPGRLLPRPTWAFENQPTVTSTACLELAAGVSPSDSSGEEDTETEGDVSSDSTLEYTEECDDADQSDSDTSLSNSNYSGTDTREFYLVGDPLADDDSESEYCVVFNSMLEAITEEDTDDMSEIERETNENIKLNQQGTERDQVDSFVIPVIDLSKGKNGNNESDFTVNNDKSSNTESTSDTNSIDVNVDTDAYENASSTSAVYGPIRDTKRPLVIGPYRDRDSKFSQEQTIQHSGIGNTAHEADKMEKEDATLSPKLQEGSYLERARAIIWGLPGTADNPQIDQSDAKGNENVGLTHAHTPSSDLTPEHNVPIPKELHVDLEKIPFQSTVDKKIKNDKIELDQSQNNGGSDIGERQDINTNASNDPISSQALQRGQDDRSSSNADSDLDSLTECFDQFKKVALNHLEHTTTSQLSDNTQQTYENGKDKTERDNDEFNTLKSDNLGVIEKETYKDVFLKDSSESNFDNNNLLSEGKYHDEVLYGESLDYLRQSDNIFSKFDDAPLSSTGRGETPAQSFTFVRTMNIERNYVLRNTSRDKNDNLNSDRFNDDKSIDELNIHDRIDNMPGMSPYVSSTIGGLSSFDNRNNTGNLSVWNNIPVGNHTRRGITPHSDQNHFPDSGIHAHPRGGPIAETTVGKFDLRPHPQYKELELNSQFIPQHEKGFHDSDQIQVKTTETMYNKGSNKVGNEIPIGLNKDLAGLSGYGHSNEPRTSDQRSQMKWNGIPQENVAKSLDKSNPTRFDPSYFQSIQPYEHSGQSFDSDQNSGQLANRTLFNVDELADRETLDLKGNIVAHRNMYETQGTPCRVVATSSALARRGDTTSGIDPELPPAGSAVASTEATSDNPYIAVARATARAATIASANAAGAVATGTDDPESSGDISVVVSTSCTIKEGSKDSENSAPKIAYPYTESPTQNNELDLQPSQKKKMMITIEESQDTNRREYRTLECEVPKDIDGDVTSMISDAVKRIIASQSSLVHQREKELHTAIDQVTRQVLSAYPQQYGDFSGYSSPPDRLAIHDTPTVKAQAIPDFRTQNTPQLYHEQTPPRPALSIMRSTRDSNIARPGAYLSRVINKPGDPDKSSFFSEKDDQPVFYVTGKYPTSDSETRTDDVVLKVVTDQNMQPSVEHVLLSESESDIETPLMERKQYDRSKMKVIKEETNSPTEDSEFKKKKKPARPKLQQPTKSKSTDLIYVPPESWSVCTGCPSEKDMGENKIIPKEETDKAVKGILKVSPSSNLEDQHKDIDKEISKSERNGNISTSNRYQPLPKPSTSAVETKDSSKKLYQSVLLTPIKKEEKKEKPSEVLPPTSISHIDPLTENKGIFFKDQKLVGLENKSDVPVAIPNTRPTRIDIEFDRRKKEWRARTPSPKSNVVMVDIDIDGSKKARSRSVENIKQKLSRAQLKAPSNDHIEKEWEGVSQKLSRSQDRVGGYRSRGDSFSSDVSQSYSGGMRRSTSMGTLPGQFFSDKRSYTSLIETDLDTGVSTEIPLIKETNVDEILTKSKSMTNLNTATSFKTFDIYSDDVRYKSSEMLSNHSSQSSEKDAANDRPVPLENKMNERCRSAHELRISNSLSKLSLPPWFQATETPPAKPVQLINTKTPPRTPFELPKSGEKSKPRPKLEILPSKPIIINHRVSRSVSKSPSSSTCSTPVSGPPSFELPSTRLRQSRETSLSPIPIKSPQEVPPLPPRNYPRKETARDSYLKLKAKANPDTWEPLSALQSPTNPRTSVTPYKSEEPPHESHYYHSRPSSMTEGNELNKEKGHWQEEVFVSQKYISLSNSENSSVMSEPYVPKLPPRNYLGESSDSGVASLEHTHRYDSPIYARESTNFTPGRTVTSLVKNLKIDTNQISLAHNSGLDSGSPNSAYQRMMTTLESERKDIENKASEISQPYVQDEKSVIRNSNPITEPEPDKNSFPVLSLTSSPGTKRRSFRSADSVRSLKEPEPTTVTMTLSRQSFKNESRNEATLLDGNRKESHSLDEVLGGLLAIPPPPGHPDDYEDEEFADDYPAEETPKERNFKILKQASTPKTSQASLTQEKIEQPENEIDEDTVIIQCRNTKCGKTTKLSQARKSYKTCHNCFTYYCSRDCRKEHWERHKKKCLFSRINSGCKHIIKKVQNSDTIAEELSKIARTGYLTKGRGCVMLVFPTPFEADKFLMKGFEASQINPANYANIKDIQDARDVFAEHENELVQMCKSYNPELKYVIEVAIVSSQETPTWPIPRKEGPIIKKSAKVRLHSSAASKQTKKDEPETLVLTAVPGAEFTENMEEKKAREICFVNIQRQLRQKGVSLRHQYPDIYNRLCAYVENNEHFTPISLYPLDGNTGKRFMCLIMPNSEPEVNWMYDPGLLEDLDLHTQI